jgi:multiple sugar transport system substrate-binding protein
MIGCVIVAGSFLCGSCTDPRSKTVTIRFARWARIEESQRFQYLINQFEKDNPHITVKAEYLPVDSYLEKTTISLQTGDAPDVFMMSSAMTAQFVSSAIPLQRLDHLDLDNTFSRFSPRILAPITKYGARYGMPVELGMRVLFYNKDILREEGIPMPSETDPMTWDEFANLLARIRKANPSGTVTVYPLRMDAGDLLECLLNAYQTPLFGDAVSQDTSQLVRERAVSAFTMLDSLYRKDLLPSPGEGQDKGNFGTTDTALAGKNVAFMYSGLWSLPLLQAANVNVGTMPMPQAVTKAATAEIDYLMISPESPNKEAAWTMIEWFATKGQSLLGTNGDYPARIGYDPMSVVRNASNGLYRTLAGETERIVPSVSILNPRIRAEYERCLTGVVEGTLDPEQAVSGLIDVMSQEIGKGVVRE